MIFTSDDPKPLVILPFIKGLRTSTRAQKWAADNPRKRGYIQIKLADPRGWDFFIVNRGKSKPSTAKECLPLLFKHYDKKKRSKDSR